MVTVEPVVTREEQWAAAARDCSVKAPAETRFTVEFSRYELVNLLMAFSRFPELDNGGWHEQVVKKLLAAAT